MASASKTSLWKDEGHGKILVEEFPDLPFGSLSQGQRVMVPGHGEAVCTGVSRSGSGSSAQVVALDLTLVR